MGESANLYTKCQKEYNSERSVVSELMLLGFSQAVLCIRYSMQTFCMWGGENIYKHLHIVDLQVLQYFIILPLHIPLLACSVVLNLLIFLCSC